MHTERESYGTGLCLVQVQCGARRKREGKWHGDMTAQLAAASSDRRRSTALARWLRATTLNSCKSRACTREVWSPSRAATAWEMSVGMAAASRDHAPVASTTRGWKRTPWAAQALAVSRCISLVREYAVAAASAVCPAWARLSCRCGATTARSSAAGKPLRLGK